MWKTVQAGSRFLSSAETRYAMIELELLAVAWACQKAAAFVEGIKFVIVVDHKPLVPIMTSYGLNDIENKRLQRLRMKLDHLSYEVIWIPGKDHVEADALSRAPVDQPSSEDEVDEPNIFNVFTVEDEDEDNWTKLSNDLLIQQILEEQDDEYRAVCQLVLKGQARPGSTPCPAIDPYIKILDELRQRAYFAKARNDSCGFLQKGRHYQNRCTSCGNVQWKPKNYSFQNGS